MSSARYLNVWKGWLYVGEAATMSPVMANGETQKVTLGCALLRRVAYKAPSRRWAELPQARYKNQRSIRPHFHFPNTLNLEKIKLFLRKVCWFLKSRYIVSRNFPLFHVCICVHRTVLYAFCYRYIVPNPLNLLRSRIDITLNLYKVKSNI